MLEIFDDPQKLTLLYVITTLDTNAIDYKKKTDDYGVRIRLTSGVELTFGNEDEIKDMGPNELMIISFALS